MKVSCTCATALMLALTAYAGFAVAAVPCWKAAIGDWYEDGRFDQVWSCTCLRDAVDHLPVDGYSSVRDDFQRQLEFRRCVGTARVVTVTATQTAGTPGTDRNLTVSDDSFPWEVAIVGGVAIGLVGLVGLAVLRQWRRGS